MADDSEEFIEQRLSRTLGMFCLPYNIQVIIPDSCLKKCPSAVEKIRATMQELFKGTTTVHGVGTWEGKDGKPVVEPVAIIESSHNCTDPFKLAAFEQAVGEAAADADQEAVAIKAGRLFIVPPGSLIAPRV